MNRGWGFDEVKTGRMGGASAAKTCVLTCVLASEATLQMASLHLTQKGRGAFCSMMSALAKQVRTSSSKIAHVKTLSMVHDSLQSIASENVKLEIDTAK